MQKSVALAACLGLIACDAFDKVPEAREMAQASMYYAQLGVQLNQVESQFAPVVQQLSEAVADASKREAAVAAADALVSRIEGVVEANRPAEGDAHPGYQAAKRMVEMRRQAVAQLRQSFGPNADTVAATNALTAFSSAWMNAQQQFMASVGGHSQQIFGPAAQRAFEGSGAGNLPSMPSVPSATGGK